MGLMLWCFVAIHSVSGSVPATPDPGRFRAGEVSMFVWEAFVTAKTKGLLHHEDASFAVAAFRDRWPDVPAALNHAASALRLSGFSLSEDEPGAACVVIAAAPRALL